MQICQLLRVRLFPHTLGSIGVVVATTLSVAMANDA